MPVARQSVTSLPLVLLPMSNTYYNGTYWRPSERYANTNVNFGNSDANGTFEWTDVPNFLLNTATGVDDFRRAYRALGVGDRKTDWGQLAKSTGMGLAELGASALSFGTYGVAFPALKGGFAASKAARAAGATGRVRPFFRGSPSIPRGAALGSEGAGGQLALYPEARAGLPGFLSSYAAAARRNSLIARWGIKSGARYKSKYARFLAAKATAQSPREIASAYLRFAGGGLASTARALVAPGVVIGGLNAANAAITPRLTRNNIEQGRLVPALRSPGTSDADRAAARGTGSISATPTKPTVTTSNSDNVMIGGMLSNLDKSYSGSVSGLKQQYQLAETEEEKARIRYILADLEAQRSAGLKAIADLYSANIGKVNAQRDESIAGTQQAVQDVSQLYADTGAGLERRTAEAGQMASDFAPGAGLEGYAPKNEFVDALAALSPIEQTYSQRIGDISASGLAATAEGMRGEQAAQAGDLERLALATRGAALMQHDKAVQDRIAQERMLMMQLAAQSGGGGGGGEAVRPIYQDELSEAAYLNASSEFPSLSNLIAGVKQRYGDLIDPQQMQQVVSFLTQEYQRAQELIRLRELQKITTERKAAQEQAAQTLSNSQISSG